jgi:hypothetical protein
MIGPKNRNATLLHVGSQLHQVFSSSLACFFPSLMAPPLSLDAHLVSDALQPSPTTPICQGRALAVVLPVLDVRWTSCGHVPHEYGQSTADRHDVVSRRIRAFSVEAAAGMVLASRYGQGTEMCDTKAYPTNATTTTATMAETRCPPTSGWANRNATKALPERPDRGPKSPDTVSVAAAQVGVANRPSMTELPS